MELKQRINDDLKTAMLGGDRFLTETLRGLKSAVLYEEVAKNKRDEGLNDAEIEQVLAREAKKRTESAELFKQGGNQESAEKELKEKQIIENYLPSQISDEELAVFVRAAIAEAGDSAHIGQIIGAVKGKVGNSADGGRIAVLVKKALE
jgi:hypothetical protein